MSATIAGGQVFAVIIGLMILEGTLLTIHALRTGRGIAPLDLLPNLAAGIGLLGAAGLATAGAGAGWIGASLALALLAHLFDITHRWRRGESIKAAFSHRQSGSRLR